MEKYRMTRTTSLLFKALVDLKDGTLLKAVRGNSRRAHFRWVRLFLLEMLLHQSVHSAPPKHSFSFSDFA